MVKIFSQSSLIPLSKISNAPTKSIKILWTLFFTVMLIGLIICITLVVIQYCHHQTIFQLDFSGKQVAYDAIPAVTLCHNTKNMVSMFRNLLERQVGVLEAKKIMKSSASDGMLPWQHSRIKGIFLNITHNLSIISNNLERGLLKWSSLTAKSPFYKLLHNITVNFKIIPYFSGYQVTAYEQVPHVRSFLCTTFEFKTQSGYQPWVKLEILVNSNASLYHQSMNEISIITHEAGSLPFSAYDRHITETLNSGNKVQIFLSKSITMRLNTDRNPCNEYTSTINLFGRNYSYSHDVCGWKMCCTNCFKGCNCICPIDVLRQISNPCNETCRQNSCARKGNYTTCPSSCIIIKYNKHNKNIEKINKNSHQLILIKSDNVHIATEEKIYTITKLFSEIGGLCSLFIGFSCIYIFELIEAVILWHSGILTECINVPGGLRNDNITRYSFRGKDVDKSSEHCALFSQTSSNKDIPFSFSISLEEQTLSPVSRFNFDFDGNKTPAVFLIKTQNEFEKGRFINAVKEGRARLKVE